jgi:AcrR family transcriptional regulator
MANLVPKTPAEAWLRAARDALVSDGIDAVKVDRLAQGLGVTRGGFYHHFADREALLAQLLALWEETVVFIPRGLTPANPAEALAAIDGLVEHLIGEKTYDPRFDMAVRAWAHADRAAAAAVDRVDRLRIAALRGIFSALGCAGEEADVRARVFYFHQIGYYAIGLRESRARRLRHVQTYIRILCGDSHLERARRWAESHGANRSAPEGARLPSR